jgi:hypothetical protein
LVTTSANAQAKAVPEGGPPLPGVATAKGSLRAVFGVGLGNVGFAGVAAAEAIPWPSRYLGVGAQAFTMGQVTLLDDRTSAFGFGPLFSIRWPATHGVWELTSGAGPARLLHVYVDPCLLGCVDATERRRASWGIHGTLGVKFMAGTRDGALYGLGLRADVLGRPRGGYPEPEVVFTVNAIIGAFFGGAP